MLSGNMRSIVYQILSVLIFSTLICCKPLENVVNGATNNEETVGEEGLPNLRKVLYPTYAREPYGTDFYTNIDMGNPSYGTWGPMYRYNDLFDRPMRSHLGNDQLSSVYVQSPQHGSFSSFNSGPHLPFVPYYSGIGKGR